MNIPSEKECLDLLKVHNPKVMHHSIFVKEVSLKIADILSMKGILVNKELIAAGALLHDIKKTFNGPDEHNVRGCEFLTELGYPEVGKISKNHFFESELESYEEKIVYYADKLCNRGQILVSLDERINYAIDKYNFPKHKKDAWLKEALDIENELLGENRNLLFNGY